MPVQINTIEELQELLDNLGIGVTSFDELQELLKVVNQGDMPPEAQREWQAAREREREREYAHQEKMRQLEHVERLRALELGHVLPTAETAEAMAKMVGNAAEAAGWIGIVVPLGSLGIAIGTTYMILEKMEPSSLLAAVLGIVWGTCALVGLLGVVLALGTIRKRGFGSITAAKVQGRPGETPDLDTAIKRTETPVEIGA